MTGIELKLVALPAVFSVAAAPPHLIADNWMQLSSSTGDRIQTAVTFDSLQVQNHQRLLWRRDTFLLPRWDRVKAQESLIQIDCLHKTALYREIVTRDYRGQVLKRQKNPIDADSHAIKPDTVEEEVYNLVCPPERIADADLQFSR